MAYVYAKINKATLAYICNSKGVTTNFIVDRTKLPAEKLQLWLDTTTDKLPTIRQAKAVAKCIHVPFAGLYMNPNDIPLKRIPNVRNMRTLVGAYSDDDSALNIAMLDVLLERDFLINANSELNQDIPAFSFTAPNCDDPSVWANSIRTKMGLDLSEQYRCATPRQYYLYLRNKLEMNGVFIQCFTDVPLECARGFAIYEETLPIIGINDADRPPAKSFTMIHELVHLMKRESSLCNEMFNRKATIDEEIFCNAVAGELLVPERALRLALQNENVTKPYAVETIKIIADHFSVSREVIIRRLLSINEIDNVEYDSYADLFRKEVEQEREKQRIARQAGVNVGIPKNISREAVDRTSPSISRILYYGYGEDFYSKQDIARHLGIDQKHINKFLLEVSKWSK